MTRSTSFLIILSLIDLARPALADQFEQLDGPWLVKALKGPDVTARPNLTITDIIAMPAILRDTNQAVVLAKTDLGNPVRLLVVAELRKPAGGVGEPIPVVVLERLDSFDAAEPSTRLANRKDLVVFDGFQVDLDTGQVVPPGQGGDLIFRNQGEGGPRIESLGGAKLYTMSKPPILVDDKFPQPTPGKLVLPTDFAGRYRLYANGQVSGTLELKVEGRGVVTGQFRSDLRGSTYPVTGQVANDVAHKVNFAIKYPRARQEFEGYLWAEGKGAMAGVASIGEHPVGFFAIREGSKIAPEVEPEPKK